MPTITEGTLSFTFPDGWQSSKYDAWSFYRNQFQSVCGAAKAVDILAIDPGTCLWMIEAKDYRHSRRTKAIKLPDEVALKVRDSLSGIFAARVNANDAGEKELAGKALKCPRIRVVLHLEQPRKHSKLFPRAIDPADVQQRLKQLVKAIDPHPLVLEMTKMGSVSWQIQRAT